MAVKKLPMIDVDISGEKITGQDLVLIAFAPKRLVALYAAFFPTASGLSNF